MAWQAYHVVLRLRAPLHVGAGKVGNLQRTRPYVAGRNLWGALTAGLTRRAAQTGPVFDDYDNMGCRIHDNLAFTYFYPTTCADGTVSLWPWGDEVAEFRYRFLSTYGSTALDYSAASAEEASLHEVECITPHTRDKGEPVYLTGYLFQREDTALEWERLLADTQIGGERGYGWGRVTLKKAEKLTAQPVSLFDTGHLAHLDGERVRIELAVDKPLLAHALAAAFDGQSPLPGATISGAVEPLVGRETRNNAGFGQSISQARICYAPGGNVVGACEAHIGRYGVWEAVNHAPA